MRRATTVAITMGDPGGIGPEIALKALAGARFQRSCRFVIVGSRKTALRAAKILRLPAPPVWDKAAGPGAYLWEPGPRDRDRNGGRFRAYQFNFAPGRTGKTNALAAVEWIRAAVDGCLAGEFDAMVTAPICKESLAAAGIPFPGHTEYLAALTGVRKFAMLLMGGPLRVIPATRHLPLRRVADNIDGRAIGDAVEMAAEAAPWLGLKNKTVGVCALNPHAGDGGALGDEEKTIVAPAIKRLKKRGIAVAGPVAADAIFHQAAAGKYGIVVAMYHDQGLGPLKTLAFDTGVNLTLGLPIVRVSPDHGTAFDIAGTGRANPGSMIAAIRLAIELARRPNPWRNPP